MNEIVVVQVAPPKGENKYLNRSIDQSTPCYTNVIYPDSFS